MSRISLTALAFVVLCGPVFAAETATTAASAAQCTALEKQYDAASKDKVAADKLKKAQSQRTKGGDLCAQGKTSSGVKALKSALKDIGVKPAAS
jgi:hypothetical protein